MAHRFVLLGLLVCSPVLYGQETEPTVLARTYHARATSYYNLPNPTDRTDSLALRLYQQALAHAPKGPATARLRFDCHEKIGIFHQTFERQREALLSYRRAIAECRAHRLPDSLLFIPYLYSGSAHYFLQNYDSTAHFFKQAEALYNRNKSFPEAQRLFNSLGILYHESGNFRQSINYFGKALQVQLRKNRHDSAAVYSYKSNIATALRNLNAYDSAASVYQSLIPLVQNRDKLYTNLGLTYLSKRQPEQALFYFKKVRIDSANALAVQNALARTYLQQARLDAAQRALDESLWFAARHGYRRAKNPQLGLTYKLLGDVAFQQRDYRKAIQRYQQSILQLDFSFNATDVFQNPENFTQGFSSYLLFETLQAKAEGWRALHRLTPDRRAQEAAIGAYRSAFRLADYIEKSFDNEEARLFTVQKVHPVYRRAVAYLVQAHEETGDPSHLEEAFRWSEKSKAAVLAIGLKENRLKGTSGIPDSLLSRERTLRMTLSRLMLRVENAVDPAETEHLTAQLRDTELSLSRLTDALHDYPDYYRRKFSFDSVDIAALQRNVLGPQTALLSYFRAEADLFGFVLTRQRLRYFRVSHPRTLDVALRGLLTHLRTVVPGRAYGGRVYAEALYDQLIRPAEPHLTGVRSLLVIPHDELAQLPFEALHDYRQRYLLERFDVTYQYAASFLQGRRADATRLSRMLSVAPFAGGISGEFAPLTASQREISQFGGDRIVNQHATKANFLRMAGRYPVLHLATHAVADNTDPARSFVAFYPTSYASNRLYAHEISYGTLPNTELVFLSACETASGKLIRGEGVMSLSRAFSYAGCPNLVTTLWKAEDNATAYVSSRFYAHLRAGEPFSKALQRAKLDLLRDRRQVQFHSPQYWSHLVFIGTPPRSAPSWGLWLLGGLGLLGGGLLLWRWKRRRSVPRFELANGAGR